MIEPMHTWFYEYRTVRYRKAKLFNAMVALHGVAAPKDSPA